MGKTKGTVLIVDDEFAIAETLKDLVEDEGYRVVLGRNGKEAIALIATEKPDVVVTDVMMPIMGGIELVKTLRADAATKALPVILMSGAPSSAVLRGTLAPDEISAFLRKPFDLSSLLTLIAQLVGPTPAK